MPPNQLAALNSQGVQVLAWSPHRADGMSSRHRDGAAVSGIAIAAYRYVCIAGSLGPARDPPVAHPATSATLNSGWRRSPGTGVPSRAADSSGASANMPASIREAERTLDAPRPAEVEEAR